MNEYKKKLNYFLEKIKGEFSILEIEKFFDEVEVIFPNIDEVIEVEPELAERFLVKGFYKRVNVYESYINQWDKGLWFPNEEELKKLKRYQEKFNEKLLPTYGDLKNQVSPGSSARSTIEEEEKNSKERKKTLDRLLLENDKPDTQKEQMAKLQDRINSLEQKQSQNPNSDTSEQTKQELTRLKSELAALKTKQNQQNDNNPKPNGFPWMALGAGIVIAMLLLVIAFLYRKSKK